MHDELIEELRAAHANLASTTRAYRRAMLCAKVFAAADAREVRDAASKKVYAYQFEQELFVQEPYMRVLEAQHDAEEAMRLAQGELECVRLKVLLLGKPRRDDDPTKAATFT